MSSPGGTSCVRTTLQRSHQFLLKSAHSYKATPNATFPVPSPDSLSVSPVKQRTLSPRSTPSSPAPLRCLGCLPSVSSAPAVSSWRLSRHLVRDPQASSHAPAHHERARALTDWHVEEKEEEREARLQRHAVLGVRPPEAPGGCVPSEPASVCGKGVVGASQGVDGSMKGPRSPSSPAFLPAASLGLLALLLQLQPRCICPIPEASVQAGPSRAPVQGKMKPGHLHINYTTHKDCRCHSRPCMSLLGE